jgi:hypothetical protein
VARTAALPALPFGLMEWLECHSWRRSLFLPLELFRSWCNAWFPLKKVVAKRLAKNR